MAFASRTPNRSSSWDTTGPQRVEPSHTRWSCSRADAAAPQHSQASPPALPLATVIVSMARFPTPRRPYSRTLIEACTSLIFRTSLISRPKSSAVSPGACTTGTRRRAAASANSQLLRAKTGQPVPVLHDKHRRRRVRQIRRSFGRLRFIPEPTLDATWLTCRPRSAYRSCEDTCT